MKPLQLTLAFFAAVAAAFAQDAAPVVLGDLQLTNGRTYKAASVVSDSPIRLTIRHAGGLAQIEKRHLPAELQARFPADTAAHEKAEREAAERRAAAAAEWERTRPEREARAKRVAAEQRQRAAHNAAVEAEERTRAASRQGGAEATVQRAVENYFRTTWRPGSNAVTITDMVVTLDTVEAKAGWAGQYNFSGEAYVEYYMSKGSSFTSNRVRFRGEMDERGKCKIEPR